MVEWGEIKWKERVKSVKCKVSETPELTDGSWQGKNEGKAGRSSLGGRQVQGWWRARRGAVQACSNW